MNRNSTGPEEMNSTTDTAYLIIRQCVLLVKGLNMYHSTIVELTKELLKYCIFFCQINLIYNTSTNYYTVQGIFSLWSLNNKVHDSAFKKKTLYPYKLYKLSFNYNATFH